jgi:hypothetical protein
VLRELGIADPALFAHASRPVLHLEELCPEDPPEIMAKWPRAGVNFASQLCSRMGAAKTGKEGQVKVKLLDEPVLGWTKTLPHLMARD